MTKDTNQSAGNTSNDDALARLSKPSIVQPPVRRRRLSPMPTETCFPQLIRDRLRLAERAIPDLKPDRVYKSALTRERLAKVLRHEIADQTTRMVTQTPSSNDRTHLEKQGLAQLDDHLLAKPGRLVEALWEPRRAMDLGGALFRTSEVCVGDRNAGIVLFPIYLTIPARAENIRALILPPSGTPSLFDAIVALVSFLNLHPYMDGNGRTARMLFNRCLRAMGMPAQSYFPLGKLIQIAQRGFEVRVRFAEVGGTWGPIVQFITDAILELSQTK